MVLSVCVIHYSQEGEAALLRLTGWKRLTRRISKLAHQNHTPGVCPDANEDSLAKRDQGIPG